MRSAPSHPRTNGCSTTFMFRGSRFGKSESISRAGFIAGCPSLPGARSRAIRASSDLPGHSSRTPTAGSIDRRCVRFVGAYQRVQPLTIGELWALPITLRLVLIENLRRSAEQIASGRVACREADTLADQLLGVGGRAAEAPEMALRRFDSTPLPTPFVVRLLQRLRDQDPRVTPALVWLDERLAQRGHDRRRDRPQGASAAGRDEGDRPQRDYEHAPHFHSRLGGDLRERQSRRCGAPRRQPLRGDGLPHSGSLSACDRRAGARLGAHGTGHHAACDCGRRAPSRGPPGTGDASDRPRAGARLLPHRERPAGIREGHRVSHPGHRLAGSRQHASRNRRLRRGDRDSSPCSAGPAAARAFGIRHQRMAPRPARASRLGPGVGFGCRGHQPRHHQ